MSAMKLSALFLAAATAAALGGTVHAQTTATQPPATTQAPVAPPVIGPSAPVPPEVAIPRPTDAEVAQVNAALQRFIDSEKPESKALLKKYQPLFTVQRQRLNVAAT